MALTAPGQVEWDGQVLDVAGPLLSGLWITSTTDVAGWTPLWKDNDIETSAGTSAGPQSPAATYPSLTGVAVETPELLLALEASMAKTVVPRPLSWWDPNRDIEVTVNAVPRGIEASRERNVQHYSHKVVALRWLNVDRHLYTLAEEEFTVSAANPLVTHPGSEPAPWRLEIVGPRTGPRIRNVDDPEFVWRWDDLVLTADQTLQVDSRARTAVVVEDGEDDVSVWMDRTGDDGTLPLDWGILPAGTHVGFAAVSGSGDASLFVRGTW